MTKLVFESLERKTDENKSLINESSGDNNLAFSYISLHGFDIE